MVKKLVISILVIFVLILIRIYSSNKESIEKILVLNDELPLNSKQKKAVLIDLIDDKLYLKVENFVDDFGKTEKLIIYDISLNEKKIINIDTDIKIVDYYIKNQDIYYVTIENQDNMIRWKLKKSDFNFDKDVILLEGLINNVFYYPSLFTLENNLYLSYLDEFNEVQKVAKIFDDNITDLLILDHNKNKIYDLEKVIIEKENIYYITISEEDNKLMKYNVISNNTDIVYEASTDKELVFDYLVFDNVVVVNAIEDNSTIVFCYKDGSQKRIKVDAGITTIKKWNESSIIFLDKNKELKIIDLDGNIKKVRNFNNYDITYNFLINNSNTLIFKDNINNIYKYNFIK